MSSRPDVIDLIGSQFDREQVRPAERTLIICAAPRTGSYELCRFLTAAGIGVPHEYFHPQYAGRIAARWGLGPDPLGENSLGPYIEMLRTRRASGEVFAFKLMFPQFERSLRNVHGAALFRRATVVHLFRPDIVAQWVSLRNAQATGQWDFSHRQTSAAQIAQPPETYERVARIVDYIVTADAGFRRIFALLGIRPLFITMDELFADPAKTVQRIAEATQAQVDSTALSAMVAASVRYAPRGSPLGWDPDKPPQFQDWVFGLAR